MQKTKIDWCGYVWNPVWGCLNTCPYCYARKMARRFWKIKAEKEILIYGLSKKDDFSRLIQDKIRNFSPIFLRSNFEKDFPLAASRIFVNSMSDIMFWTLTWMMRVIERIKSYPKHTFIFLTKYPEIYLAHNFPANCWLGVTIDSDIRFAGMTISGWKEFRAKKNKKFISFEPLISIKGMKSDDFTGIDWVIIGLLTGGKYIAPLGVELILDAAREHNIPVFMKESMRKYCKNFRQEYPKEGDKS